MMWGLRRSWGQHTSKPFVCRAHISIAQPLLLQRLTLDRQSRWKSLSSLCLSARFCSQRLIEGKTEWKVRLTSPGGLEVQAAGFF